MADDFEEIRRALASRPARVEVGEVRSVSAGESLNPWHGGKDEWD